ncbi:cyclic nucleotide-binding domain-containing protein [Peribacillus simplex]|uniref:Cyclic nucleotide-binding domain-containing protein n=2 Tax=Peribacillus TaxID=2675229 RepID=A0AA90P6T3_9BACI|nr:MULTISPECIES: cyclic nucleotide-binding domain-containing protein [Peribacillus]MDP1421926.1 cyclic nucleotide-binding domain-containing protein [Peribacillus simplex]MDP1454599.1 cyclic nucleotide-binding domain-containing protein [Peribacillus frigoritolerans]
MKEIMDSEKLNHYLEAHQLESIFNGALMSYLSLYQVKPGECICSQGDRMNYLYVLVKGKVKVYTTSDEGKNLILSFKTPLEVIGDIEYIQGIDIINTVEAVSDVYVIGIHHQWLKKYAEGQPAFLQFLLRVITQKFYVKSKSLSFNLMHPVEVRLASYLLSVSFDETSDQITGRLNTESLKDTANFIGTSYRHLNRVILQLCRNGLIDRSEGFIQVKDWEGLKALSSHNIYE